MDILESISSLVAHSFMLVITSFTFIFFIAIYLTADRYKSVLLVAIANGLKLISIILVYIGTFYINFETEAIINFLSSVQVTLWITAIFIILRIKVRMLPVIIINLINLAQGILFVALDSGHEMIHSLNSLIIAMIALFCIIIVVRNGMCSKRTETVILIFSLSLFTAFHLVRGYMCFVGMVVYGSFLESDAPFKFMSILRYAFFHLMNFVIIYLNHNYLLRKVKRLSYTDKLTGALNRTFFFKMLEVKLSELKRMDKKIVLAILDIDDFKNVNDTYGHLVGDEALRGFTDHLKENIRKNDIICRYGGEEFLILMEVAGKKEAELAIKRLQDSIRGKKITEHEICLTFSCGMEYLGNGDGDRDIIEIIKLIDGRLYQAKHAGKDCIV